MTTTRWLIALLPCVAFAGEISATRQEVKQQIQQQQVITQKQQVDFNLRFIEDGIFKLETKAKLQRLTPEEQMSLNKLRGLREEQVKKQFVLEEETRTIRNTRAIQQSNAEREASVLKEKAAIVK